MLSEWSIAPGASRPNPLAMNDFNILSINSRAYPGTAPLVVEQGKKVRLRFGNLSAMDHHSMHLHGHAFRVVATDGGPVPASAQHPETTTLVIVGSTRTVEFVADAAGDWPLHCHMTHHAMNQMGHGIPSMVGANIDQVAQKLRALSPSTMVMGDAGMGGMDHMFHMGMKMPENSIPMLGGKGPFSAIEMGGMFTVVKVRPAGHLGDEWHTHPKGTVAGVATDDELAADGIKIG